MSSEPKPHKRKRAWLMRRVVAPLGLCVYRALGATWRYVEVHGDIVERERAAGRPLIGAFLHTRTFSLLHHYSQADQGNWVLMCSQSRDGDAMAQIEEGLGYRVVRGSSGGGGAKALVAIIRAVKKEGYSTCLAVDGSRGPRGVAQPGILTLAQKTGGALVPVAASARWSFVWRWSWDRTVLPLPFAKVYVAYGEPIPVPSTMDAAQAEVLRAELESRLLALHTEADGLSGFSDTVPLRVADASHSPAGEPHPA